jgi:hypothetical protein
MHSCIDVFGSTVVVFVPSTKFLSFLVKNVISTAKKIPKHFPVDLLPIEEEEEKI